MHEIITVQLGQRSNYLATHFWNTQESYFTYSPEDPESPVDHDIHWRPGIGADGHTETFMPRTVIYDLKGGFGSMRKINALYESQEDDPTRTSLWGGSTVVQRQQPIEPSAYQQSLDSGLPPPTLTTGSVRYWSDYSRVYYHPRSVVQINEYEVNSSLMPFERWSTGKELFDGIDKEHDIVDRDLRPFVEEADQMQGIQVFTGLDDAWGGFASEYAERLRDEYGKTVIWVWGLEEPVRRVSRPTKLLRLANKARTLTEVYKQASILIPLAVPSNVPRGVEIDWGSAWHTGGLLASAIESVTLPSRLRGGMGVDRDTLGGMTDLLNVMGKQTVAGLQMSFSPPAAEDQPAQADSRQPQQQVRLNGEDEEDGEGKGVHLDIDFSPSDHLDHQPWSDGYWKLRPKVFSQIIARRGYPETDGRRDEDGDVEMEMEMDQGERNRRRRPRGDEPVTQTYNSTSRFPLLDSFPRIFKNTETGESISGDNGGLNVTTSLSTDSSVSTRLKMLRQTVNMFFGVEDRETLMNDLAQMADEYHEGWSSGSDEGEDD